MAETKKAFGHTAPEPLAAFLIYIESIQGKSKKTVDEYFYDLRTFYRFLKIYYGKVSDDVAFSDITIEDVDLTMLRSVDLQTIYEYMNYLNRVRGNAPRARARKAASLFLIPKIGAKTVAGSSSEPSLCL